LKELVEKQRDNDVDFACIYRFNIKPSTSWVLEVLPVSGNNGPYGKVYEMKIEDEMEPTKLPDCTLTYDSEDVFIDVTTKKLSPQKAFIKRKLVIKGNMAKMRFLQNLLDEGHKQHQVVHGAGGDGTQRQSMVVRPRSEWIPDKEHGRCTVCAAKFRITVRRHHCRFCGSVVCATCSDYKLNGHRACAPCASSSRRAIQRAPYDTAVALRERVMTTVMDNPDVDILKQQVVELQDKVESLTKESDYTKARLILTVVYIFHKLLVGFLLFLAVGLAHLLAACSCVFLGNKLVLLLDLNATGFTDDTMCWEPQDEGISLMAELLTNMSLKNLLEEGVLVYWLIMFYCFMAMFAYHFIITKQLIPRRLKTLSLAAVAILWLRATRRKCKRLSKAEADATWDSVHRILSPYMYLGILGMKGLWVKAGQYLSSRADVMPVAFLEELQKLQDCVPPSPIEQVKETIERGLGDKISNIFESFDEDVLAAASIAQVHRATLKDGTEVVVKVQHPEVQHLMLEDILNIRTIVTVVAFFEPEFDFRTIMDEWTKGVRRELDFKFEAENLERVYKAMSKSGQNVEIPKLIPSLVSERVVVMTFCKGWKVTDWYQLNKLPTQEREKLMESICKAFAYQMHVDGLFNGDPHPGNILVQAEEKNGGKILTNCKPVLLDWGLAKAFDTKARLAFAKFVYSTSEMDFVSMLQSFEEMGIKLNRFDPGEDMNNTRHMFRDTAPPEEARSAHKKWERKWIKKRKKEYKSSGRKNPVDAYPGDLLFFIRATELLHGLGARLRVRTQYLQIIAPFAKTALLEAVPPSERAKSAIFPMPCLSPLEVKVRKVVTELIDQGLITGCQVCVYKNGVTMVDTCAGMQGPVDSRPVTPKTVFCALSVSKAVLATAAHVLVDQGILRYDMTIASLWQEFAQNGKQNITLRHVLTHSTGLQHAIPDKPTFDDLCDWKKIQKTFEEAKPIWEPGTRCSYHYFSYGWLLAAVIERATNKSLDTVVQETVINPLGLQDEMFLGDITKRGVEPERIATLESDMAKRMAEMPKPEDYAEEDDDDEDGNVSMAGLAFLAAGIKEEDEAEGLALEELARKLKGREYLLDPRMFNYPPLRDAVLPAANGHFTARSLAALFNQLLSDVTRNANASYSSPPLLKRDTAMQARKMQTRDRASYLKLFGQAEGVRYGLGYQIFGFKDDLGPNQAGGHIRHTAFGHTGAGGSVAFCDPVTGLVFSMTVNKIIEGRKGTNTVLNLVCKELGVGMPVSVFDN